MVLVMMRMKPQDHVCPNRNFDFISESCSQKNSVLKWLDLNLTCTTKKNFFPPFWNNRCFQLWKHLFSPQVSHCRAFWYSKLHDDFLGDWILAHCLFWTLNGSPTGPFATLFKLFFDGKNCCFEKIHQTFRVVAFKNSIILTYIDCKVN